MNINRRKCSLAETNDYFWITLFHCFLDRFFPSCSLYISNFEFRDSFERSIFSSDNRSTICRINSYKNSKNSSFIHFYRSRYSAYPSVTPHTRAAYNCDIITRPRAAFARFFRQFFGLALRVSPPESRRYSRT